MSPEEITQFLSRVEPALLGVVGTLGRNGSPRLAPVWFRYDGERVHIWTDEQRRWVRNLLRDPRVAFSVQEPAPPYAAVVMQGRAEVTTGDAQAVSDEVRRITARYIEPQSVDAYIAGWAHLRTLVTIRPERVSSWHRGY